MKMSRLALSLAVGGTFGFSACGGDTGAPRTPAVELTLGAMLPRTGDNANDDWIAAATLAREHMNLALSRAKMDRPVTFSVVERDTASKQDVALAAMGDFAAAGALAVVAEASATAVGGNIYNYTAGNTQIPLVSFTATSGDLNNATKTDPDPVKQAALQDADNWFFRTCQLSGGLSSVRYKALFSKGASNNGDVNGDGIVKVTWVGTTAASTVSSISADITAFNTAAAAAGITFVSEKVLFDPGTADPATYNYADVITKVTDDFNEDTMAQDAFPDIIYNKALTNVSIPFIKAYRAAGKTTAMFQDGSFRRNTMLIALGAGADGQEGVSNIAYEKDASGQMFAAAQQALTGFPPAAYEAQTYDAMAVAMLAAVKASITAGDPALVTPAMVREAMTQLNVPGGEVYGTGPDQLQMAIEAMAAGRDINYEGASGNVDFDGVGNVKSRVVWWTIQNGTFVEQKLYDCVASADCPEVL